MRTIVIRLFFLIASLFALSVLSANSQDLAGLEQGIKPYGSYHSGDIDSISTVNGSLTLNIPLISYPQRGGKLHVGFSLVYENPILKPQANCNPVTHICTNASYNVNYHNQILPISLVADFAPNTAAVGSGSV